MEKIVLPAVLAVWAAGMLCGCVGLGVGTGPRTEIHNPTLGQELLDLQKAREAGAITPAEFDTKKAQLLAKR